MPSSYFAEMPLEIDGLGSLKALTLLQMEDLRFEIHKYLVAMAKEGLGSTEQGKASAAIAIHVGAMTFIDQATAVLSSPMILATAVKMMLDTKDGANKVAEKIKPPMVDSIARHVYSSYGLDLVPKEEAAEADANPPTAAGSTDS